MGEQTKSNAVEILGIEKNLFYVYAMRENACGHRWTESSGPTNLKPICNVPLGRAETLGSYEAFIKTNWSHFFQVLRRKISKIDSNVSKTRFECC